MNTILIRLPNWVGDVILATPTLHALRISFPDARIVGLGKPWARELLDGHPCLDEILTHPFQKRNERPGNTFQLLATIKKMKPSMGLLFPNSFASALLFFLARIPVRVGYATHGRGLLLNRKVEVPDGMLHQLDYFLGLLKGFSLDGNWDRSLYFPLSDERKTEADHLWRNWQVSEKDVVVGLNPGAAWGPSKRWLPEYFSKAGDMFQHELGAKIVIFGGPEDVSLARGIAGNMKAPSLNIAGKDNLRLLPALLARCNLFITNDTGPMHIAASQNVPQVVLFGPTDPHQTAYPYSNIKMMKRDLECSPCFQRECPLGHHECMVGISAAQVFHAGMDLLTEGNVTA